MIPDYIIETAMDAYVENFPGARCMRINMEAALEAVAAEIWEQGNRAGFSLGAAIGRDDWNDEDDTNPYERIEHT